MNTAIIRVHRAEVTENGSFSAPDQTIRMAEISGVQDLCDRQADFVHRAIRENLDLSRHVQAEFQSLRVCLAADESVRSGAIINL